MSKLFEYAVVFNPNKEETKSGEKPKIVIKPTTILAKNEKEVNFIAARSIPEDFADKIDRLDIAVRPF
jgi:hypothetical protein